MYEITRDGFVYIAMGFTGKKAAEFKERYIGAYFVANDVATMLGYKDTDQAVRKNCKYAKLFKPVCQTGLNISPFGVKIIPEPDVWRLIVRSKLPDAQVIEEWV